MWTKQLFKIPNSNENEAVQYFSDFFSNTLNILNCKFKLPRQINWRGHPIYYELLKMFQNLCQQMPAEDENLLSIPIFLLFTIYFMNIIEDYLIRNSLPHPHGYPPSLNLNGKP